MHAASTESRLAYLWETPKTLKGWLGTVDHKELGIRYIVTAFIFLLVGGIEALLVRIQLARPDMAFLSPEAYDQIFTMHGLTMIFWYASPILSGFAVYLIPLMIGARHGISAAERFHLFVGCTGGSTARSYAAISGNAQHGKQLIQAYGCGACHIIPGIHNARGLVGPPLNVFGERTMIAGELPNVPSNLARRIQNPPSVESNTAMPDLGLSESQAQDGSLPLYVAIRN